MNTYSAPWRGVLALAEAQNGMLTPLSLEMIGAAQILAQQGGEPFYAVLIGSDLQCACEALRYFAFDRLLVYDDPIFEVYRNDVYSDALCDAIHALKPSAVLIGASDKGKSLAPTVATRFASGLTADCTELSYTSDSELIQIRPAYGGNVMARIKTQHRPQFATVRPRVMEEAIAADEILCSVEKRAAPNIHSRIEILGCEEVKSSMDIAEQEILVAIGQGFSKKEDIAIANELAELLGGQCACSRAIVEKGWMPPDRQIGLSGKNVRPRLLIACGVSGSVQFQSGMRNSRYIIAINSDPMAPIFNIAQSAICGDIYEILPRLIQKIKSIKANHQYFAF